MSPKKKEQSSQTTSRDGINKFINRGVILKSLILEKEFFRLKSFLEQNFQ